MSLNFDLLHQQTIKLSLTPELRQSINILHYSSEELFDFLKEQMAENPLLEFANNEKDPANTSSVEGFLSLHTSEYIKSRRLALDDNYDPFNHYSAKTITLENYLLEQINTMPHLKAQQKKLIHLLIGNLDHNGFLALTPEEVAILYNIAQNDIKEALTILQSLEPAGVGARNLSECLLLQIKEQHQLAYTIIENHLNDLVDMHVRKIAALCQVTPQAVQEAVDYIRTLNPRPAGPFHTETTQYITPDVIVEKVSDEYMIYLNDKKMPILSINPYYKNLLTSSTSKQAQHFLETKLHDAQTIIRNIEQRNSTLYRVTEAIIEEQPEFFTLGITGLKPMVLKDLAEKLDLHESTISRATSNKYIQTPHGVFSLKAFFTRGVSRTDSPEIESSSQIKAKIKNLILQEDKLTPYSDQKISSILAQEGTKISRRTIAKYRDELNIPGSLRRKRYS